MALQQAAKDHPDTQEAEVLNTRAQHLLLLLEEEARRNAWDSVKEVLGFGAAIFFLSCFAGVFSAIIPAVELCAGLELFGIDPGLAGSFLPMACVFILGFFVVLWFSEDGPPRPGHGILKGDAPILIGAWVFNFFFLLGIVLGVTYWVRG